jgi:serine phosphatase RsbU (regulator of sigma subunit)/anti-sigma regulatory factor (Ser/Thr protein kinase)
MVGVSDDQGPARARDLFLTGEPFTGSVRRPILSSWERCRSMGLLPDRAVPSYAQDIDLHGRLRDAAGPVLDWLESAVSGLRASVVLADARARVLLRRAGEPGLNRFLDAVRLSPGFGLAEPVVGTNGIGMALAERRPSYVVAGEHFAEELQSLACAATPVCDPLSGRVEGIVNLTCWSADADLMMSALVREAAVGIEQRLLEQCTQREQALLRAFQAARGSGSPTMTMDARRAGLGVLPDGRLNRDDQRLLRERAAELISSGRHTVVEVPLSRGRATLRCRPVAGPPGASGVVVEASLPGPGGDARQAPGAPMPGVSGAFADPAGGEPPYATPYGERRASSRGGAMTSRLPAVGGGKAGHLPAAGVAAPRLPVDAAPPESSGAGVPPQPSPSHSSLSHPSQPQASPPAFQGKATGATDDWLLLVGEPGVGRLAVAARQRLRLVCEAGVRIGTTLDVARTAEELADVAVPQFADVVTVDLMTSVLDGGESGSPGLAAAAEAPMRRMTLRALQSSGDLPTGAFHPRGATVRFAPSTPQARAIASGTAILQPEPSDLPPEPGDRPDAGAAAVRTAAPSPAGPMPAGVVPAPETPAGPARDAATPAAAGQQSLITVPLRARGDVLGVAGFHRSGGREPFEEDDLALAEELAARAAVCIDNARRYTREHETALALQRSLLPRDLPEQSAVEVAHRYLPAQGGVGGDWFDAIPLSGGRIALVVGDVVGHGLHAAATMGRLRTAVHNFSALDLPPDELLGQLDDLVNRLDQDEAPGRGGTRMVGATCLYAVYDPVSGTCTLARAGHPPPALVRPTGGVEFLDLPAGPPLGLGGLPFETAEFVLEEGSCLALYTDGLIRDRGRDIDVGLARLREALGSPGRSPEQTCDAVLEALLPTHPEDDVALIVARLSTLDSGQVARWNLPADPTMVAQLRTAITRQLASWGLEEAAFTTELIASELITNAIRYGTEPIQVRLLRDRTLICEVSDGSSTSPRLRRASTTDEGGRGLFLVAQLAQRWGTRYTSSGKVIWTEQPLSAAASPPGDPTAR